jgi:2-polyprenyl-3-methyl-5-hydroxy-6-metoxy-1,4-benzoquinol methylase
MRKNIFETLRDYLGAHPGLRNTLRRARWHAKRIPVLRNMSIAFDRKYFTHSGTERRSEADTGADQYFEMYAPVIAARARGEVLDLGCGHGYLTERIARSSAVTKVVGMDKINEFRGEHPKIKYETADIAKMDRIPGSYDTIVSSEFVEHISEEDHERLVGKIAQALKPGGIYLGSTPHNPTPYKVFSGSQFHLREYNRRDLRVLLLKYFQEADFLKTDPQCLVWQARGRRMGDQTDHHA